MKLKSAAMIPLLLTIWMSGCIRSVIITEEISVEPSGAARRKVTVKVTTDGKNVEEAKEVLERSVLPEEPGWSKSMRREGNGYLFSAEARFDRLGSTPFDEYLHKPISFKLIRSFPFIKYEYSEEFASISELKASVTADIVEAALTEELDRIAGPIPPDRWERFRRKLDGMIKSAYMGEVKGDELKAEFRRTIEEAIGRGIDDATFNAISRKIERAISEKGEARMRQEGLIGIVEHDPDYEISLAMPGKLVGTNGEIEGDKVRWRIESETYNIGGFKAYAYSRRLNLPALILFVMVVMAAIMAGVTLVYRRRSSAGSGGEF
ncbi:TPA: hypothetical protein EYP37_09560 [Candidatus Poribacteria bacterium]|nr:hypothetical protein [Candidatus Poribacteria bacterium]